MAYEPKDGSGSLFKTDRKESDNQPDYKGQIMVGGVQYWLSAWIKKSESGRTYMSLSVQRPEEKRQERAAPPPRQQRRQDDDEIPF